MAITDRNIVITPNRTAVGNVQPKIVFTGADSGIGDSSAITLFANPENSGTLSFSGTAGQLFSITNNLTGTIFSVNDISGIPSLSVNDQGIIQLAEFNGRVIIGDSVGSDDSVSSLQISGTVTADSAIISRKLAAGVLEGKGGITYDPPGTSGSETSTNVGLAVHSGKRIVLGENGFIRTIVDATWGSALQFGQSGTGAFAGTEIFGGNDGVTLKHSTSTKLETTSTGVTVTGELKTTTLELGGTDITATATELNFVDGVTSAIQTQFTGAETRRTNNIAGAVSTITTGNLTASRALVSDSSGKVSVSSITSTELGHLDGIDQNINSNLAALASGIVTGSVTTLANADTDFGTLTTANIAGSDAFGQAVGGVTNVDLLSDPTGELDSVDLVALS